MNIQGTPEQRELIKKMGSANKVEAMEAQQAFAEWLDLILLS